MPGPFHARRGGLLIGVDTGLDGLWRLGLAGAYSRSSFDVPSRHSSGEVDTYLGTLYGSAQFGALAVRGGVAAAHHELDTQRSIRFPGYAGQVSASYSGASYQAFAEVGYGIHLSSLSLEPFIGLAHTSTRMGAFTERGDSAALAGLATTSDVTVSSLGLRMAVPFGDLTARGGISWRRAFGDLAPAATFAFASNPAVPFSVAGAPIARDTVAVEAALDWAIAPNVTLGVAYDGQFARSAQEHTVKGELRISF